MTRSWGAGVWWGGTVLLLALALTGWAASLAMARSGAAESVTTVDAAERVRDGAELPNARLVDVRIDCGSPKAIGSHAYVAGRSREPGGSDVVVVMRLDPDTSCEALASAPGHIRAASPPVVGGFAFSGNPRVIELQPPEAIAWMFALAIGLGVFGGFGVRSGLSAPLPTAERMRAAKATTHVEPEREGEGDPFRGTSPGEGLLRRPLRPSKPWFRRERRAAYLHATALWLCALLGGLWSTLFVVDAARVHRIWTQGVDAIDVELTGEETSRRFIFRTTELSVAYSDLVGGRHRGEAWFVSIALDVGVVTGLRYDPEHPDDFVTSYEHERLVGRVGLNALGVALLLLVGGLASTEARRRLRAIAEARETIHAGGEDLVLRVVDERHEIVGDRAIAILYTLELPDGTVVERSRHPERRPFLLHVATRRVLGLRHPQRPELIVLLDPDLGPLDVDADEVDRVRARYQAQRDAAVTRA